MPIAAKVVPSSEQIRWTRAGTGKCASSEITLLSTHGRLAGHEGGGTCQVSQRRPRRFDSEPPALVDRTFAPVPANTRQEARRFDSEVKMAIGAANRYAQTYWDTGSVSVEAAEAAKSADPKAGPPWRDELSSRIEYVQAWMKAHPPPDSDRA